MKPEQLQTKMKMAAKDVKSMKGAMKEIGSLIVEAAQGIVPVRTGNLRSSIAYRVEGAVMTVGSSVEYAPYVEYGTKYQKAQPYLQPAMDQSEQRIDEIMRKWGVSEFEKVAKAGIE